MKPILHYDCRESGLGPVLVGKGANGLCAVFLGKTETGLARELQRRFPEYACMEGGVDAREMAEVVRQIETPTRPVNLPVELHGTPFQKRVWQALRGVPAGTTRSYTDIARQIGKPAATRAVAGACAANKVAVIIPCHRIVCSDGRLSGYRWGVARKRELLRREGITLY